MSAAFAGLSHIKSRLRRRFGRSAIILLYHRVTELSSDPWSLAVKPAHFNEHLEVLRRHGRTLPLPELLTLIEEGDLPENSAAVTFDDGYADNLHGAKPLLERHGIPATFFLVSDAIGNSREFWWDELEKIFLQPRNLPGELRLTVGARTHTWKLDDGAEQSFGRAQRGCVGDRQLRTVGSRPALYRTLWEMLRRANRDVREKVMDELARWGNVDLTARPTHRTLAREEAFALSGGDLVEIGAHSVSHPALADLPPLDQLYELVQSKARLEEITGRPVTCFAYPYGRRGDYSGATMTLLQETGFACACANFSGAVYRRTDRLQLPRIYVRDWDGDQFAKVLSKWLHL